VKKSFVAAIAVGFVACCSGLASARPGSVSPDTAVSAPSPDRKDDAIRRAFRDVLDRDPSTAELRRYRALMDEDGWTENDIRRDLRSREGERGSSRRGANDVERIIRRAYQDILEREPDQAGLRQYRVAIIDKGWTERDVRDDLRRSPEYARVQRESAERLVKRVYRDMLGREPDAGGLATYASRVMRDGWSERELRASIERSPEYRERNTMTREKAEQIVRAAYRAVLKRDADDAGLRSYVPKVMQDKWSQARVEQELRQSDEYQNRKR
jgi:TorA maturation chaperone TorD